MTQKKRLLGLLSMLLILALAMMLGACGAKNGTAEPEPEEVPEQEEVAEEPAVEVVKAIDEIDTEGMEDIPLQIESITLFKDGTLRIVPLDDLLKNAETNNEVVDGAIYPFADSGKVKDVFLVRFDTYVSVEDRLNEAKETYEVVGITEDDEEIDLDFSLDF